VDRLDALDESIVDTVMVDWQREQLVALDYVATATLPLNQRMGMLRAAIRRTFPRVNEVSFKLLDQLSREFDQPLVASGPHPLVERLAWSVLPEREGHASRLVIHDRDTLPLSLKEPWLDAQWRTRCGTAVLTCPGIIDVAGGWSLESQLRIAQEFTGGDISPWEAWMDADDTGSIALTTPQPGMRVAPLGMGGQTRTLGNLFTDRKIPRSLRSGWPIVVHADSGVVLWVCGVTLSQSAAVRPQSQRLLHLHWLYRASEGKP
jgi:tRNA(Ile)-lysidine synthetase-like protein